MRRVITIVVLILFFGIPFANAQNKVVVVPLIGDPPNCKPMGNQFICPSPPNLTFEINYNAVTTCTGGGPVGVLNTNIQIQTTPDGETVFTLGSIGTEYINISVLGGGFNRFESEYIGSGTGFYAFGERADCVVPAITSGAPYQFTTASGQNWQASFFFTASNPSVTFDKVVFERL